MMKLLGIGLLLLSPLGAQGQRPVALETFTSPDSAFQFVYPESYELLVGERILKATQARHQGIPVCDFSTALACVIYPIERLDDTHLEAAGFSVDAVPGVTAESDCVAYADRFARPYRNESEPSSISINGRVFRFASAERAMAGHAQSSDLYRTFEDGRCYELRIAVSFSDEPTPQKSSSSKSLKDAEADSARQSLKMILASFTFK